MSGIEQMKCKVVTANNTCHCQAFNSDVVQ